MNRTFLRFLFLCLFTTQAFCQTIFHEAVSSGIEAFFRADFAGAIQILQGAINDHVLSDEERFYAHLYIGFCHLRLGNDFAIVRSHFQQAITIDPEKELDHTIIPPDLCDAYMSIKELLLGRLFVTSEPPGVSVMLIEPKMNRIERQRTPAIFAHLPTSTYQLVLAHADFALHSAEVIVKAGVSDTVNVQLSPKRKSFVKRYALYGAGALAVAAVILVATNLNGG